MMLGELIKLLEAQSYRDTVLKHGFAEPFSYRGDYSELAFERTFDVTIQSMLDLAKDCVGKTFQGYKGGEYKMDTYSYVWLAEYGTTWHSEPITTGTVWCMLNDVDLEPLLKIAGI